MRIDLHCHTKKTKSGDPVSRNATSETFVEKIGQAGVDLVAITNHNAFDIAQFNELANTNACITWPGVELDATSTGAKKRFHVIVVCDPQQVNDFSEAVDKLVGNTRPDDFCASPEAIVRAFESLNTIFVPHYADKSKAMAIEDRPLFESLVPKERLFLEPSDLRTVGICAFHGDNMIIGSDVKDWTCYESCNFAELRLPISNFDQLVLLAKRDHSVVQHLLDDKTLTDYSIFPVPGESFTLGLYNDVNIIFGEKGTGKSRILDSIADTMRNEGKSFVYYQGSQRDENLASLLDKSDMPHSCEALGASSCSRELNAIINWCEPSITPLRDYFDWVRTNGNDDAKIKMRIVKMTSFGVPDESKLDGVTKDAELFGKAKGSVNAIDLSKYLQPEEADRLIGLLDKLGSSIKLVQGATFIDIHGTNLSEFSINALKRLVAGSKGSKPIPGSTGFEAYASSRIELKRNLRTVTLALQTKPKCKREYLGPLEGKGDLYIDSLWRFPSSRSDRAEYSGTVTIARALVKLFKSACDNAMKNDYKEHLSALANKLEESSFASLDPLVGTSRYLALKDGTKYEPSNGEKGILILRKNLSEDVSVYLIDEPELGMGNPFIEDSIRPRLIELGRQSKTVVVATHNANIAVRCLPYRSIYREHLEGSIYRTYVGNPFVDKLVDIDDPSNEKNWTEISLRTLEGGREAFDERGYIYDSAETECDA